MRDWLDRLRDRSTGELLGLWLAMVAGFALSYWLLAWTGHQALRVGGQPLPARLDALPTALYFSFVTATSVGFGDVVPVGIVRALSVLEATLGLFCFGILISKFIGKRQDETLAEIQRIAFEDRLGRVRTNLHLVMVELQALVAACKDEATIDGDRRGGRWESATMVFAAELRAVHELLYRPRIEPDEAVVETILVTVGACLTEFEAAAQSCAMGPTPSPTVEAGLRQIVILSGEICGDCVPREFAPRLKATMDRIQDTARRIRSAASIR